MDDVGGAIGVMLELGLEVRQLTFWLWASSGVNVALIVFVVVLARQVSRLERKERL